MNKNICFYVFEKNQDSAIRFQSSLEIIEIYPVRLVELSIEHFFKA